MLAIQHRFEYINSYQNFQLIERLQTIEKEVLEKINDEKLTKLFEKWYEITDKRENEIIRNIYNYCEEHTFDNGLLLIGAEHRNSIRNKTKKYNNSKINWDYNFF